MRGSSLSRRRFYYSVGSDGRESRRESPSHSRSGVWNGEKASRSQIAGLQDIFYKQGRRLDLCRLL
jgi:hypothetical protein